MKVIIENLRTGKPLHGFTECSHYDFNWKIKDGRRVTHKGFGRYETLCSKEVVCFDTKNNQHISPLWLMVLPKNKPIYNAILEAVKATPLPN